MKPKLYTPVTIAARAIGVLLLVALVAVIIFSVFRIKPQTEENIGFLFLIVICAVLFIFLTVFLLIAWRRATAGAVLYLVFAGIMFLVLIIGDIFSNHPVAYGYLYLIPTPMVVTGLLLLASGYLKIR